MSNTFDFNFYKGKKVLVTGHTGFKGSWLCRWLLNLGAEVTGYALESPTEPDLFHLLDIESRMRSVTGDIRDLEKLHQVFAEAQPEIVLHLAAQPIVRESYKNPVYTYETNVMGTVNILEAVRQCYPFRENRPAYFLRGCGRAFVPRYPGYPVRLGHVGIFRQ